jgi:hypothetical protein
MGIQSPDLRPNLPSALHDHSEIDRLLSTVTSP